MGCTYRMTPFQKFLRGLQAAHTEHTEALEELIAFAEVMARKSNTLDLDEHGYFYSTASGPIEDILPTLEKHVSKLKRIQQEKGTT